MRHSERAPLSRCTPRSRIRNASQPPCLSHWKRQKRNSGLWKRHSATTTSRPSAHELPCRKNVPRNRVGTEESLRSMYHCNRREELARLLLPNERAGKQWVLPAGKTTWTMLSTYRTATPCAMSVRTKCSPPAARPPTRSPSSGSGARQAASGRSGETVAAPRRRRRVEDPGTDAAAEAARHREEERFFRVALKRQPAFLRLSPYYRPRIRAWSLRQRPTGGNSSHLCCTL